MDLMNAYPMFENKDRLKQQVANFLKGRQEYLEQFEARWGRIPDAIRESLPYRADQIDFSFMKRENLRYLE